jgi:hypothetical protein
MELSLTQMMFTFFLIGIGVGFITFLLIFKN